MLIVDVEQWTIGMRETETAEELLLVSSQNVPKQNVPDADQSFFSITGCGDKTLIDVFIQFKSLSYLCLILLIHGWRSTWYVSKLENESNLTAE